MSTPLVTRWDGEGFVTLGRSRADADSAYVIGEVYRLGVIEERSFKSHAHEFAWLREAWQNLPEDLMDLYPSQEHLRKRALIEAGFYDETIIDAGSNAAALRIASTFRQRDDFCLVIVRGPVIVIRDAKSQSRRVMNKQDFQVSKTAMMEVIALMVGVTPGQLQTERAL
jgi:hypothetical protein